MKRFEDLNLVVLDFLSDGILESVKIYEIAAVKIRNGKLHSHRRTFLRPDGCDALFFEYECESLTSLFGVTYAHIATAPPPKKAVAEIASFLSGCQCLTSGTCLARSSWKEFARIAEDAGIAVHPPVGTVRAAVDAARVLDLVSSERGRLFPADVCNAELMHGDLLPAADAAALIRLSYETLGTKWEDLCMEYDIDWSEASKDLLSSTLAYAALLISALSGRKPF